MPTPNKASLPARRRAEPLEELSPLPTPAVGEPTEPAKAATRKITLHLSGDTDEVLQAFMEEFNLTQTGVINWAIKTAIEEYRSGRIELEFRPARNRIISSR